MLPLPLFLIIFLRFYFRFDSVLSLHSHFCCRIEWVKNFWWKRQNEIERGKIKTRNKNKIQRERERELKAQTNILSENMPDPIHIYRYRYKITFYFCCDLFCLIVIPIFPFPFRKQHRINRWFCRIFNWKYAVSVFNNSCGRNFLRLCELCENSFCSEAWVCEGKPSKKNVVALFLFSFLQKTFFYT